MHAQNPTTFEQMIVSMRQRLRPTDAYLLADRLRICIGLNYSKTDETRLLKMLLEDTFRGPYEYRANNNSPKARLALWGSTWRLAGLAAAVAVNVAWISLLAYGLVKLL